MDQTLTGPSMDDTLDALADKQRRTQLVDLIDHNPQGDVPTISAGSDKADDAMDRLVRKKHVHLSKLTEYGFVDWKESAHEVTRGPNFEEIRPFLELLDDHEDELPPEWLSPNPSIAPSLVLIDTARRRSLLEIY